MHRHLRAFVRLTVAVGLSLTLAGCAKLGPTPTVASTPQNSSPVASTTPSSTPPEPSAPSAPPPYSACPQSPTHFVEKAPGTGKTVALTFDDGPGPDDPQFAAILDQYHVHATFFETGAHIAAHPDQVRLLADHGNLIAGHSWDHLYPRQVRTGWTSAYLHDQFGRTSAELRSVLNQPSCFVRPPGGFRTNVLAASSGLKLTAVLWSIDSLDWQQPGHTTAQATASIVAKATAVHGNPHPIVLMHSAKASHEPDSRVSPYRGNTLAALPTIIEWYQQHGYRFVRLDGRS